MALKSRYLNIIDNFYFLHFTRRCYISYQKLVYRTRRFAMLPTTHNLIILTWHLESEIALGSVLQH